MKKNERQYIFFGWQGGVNLTTGRRQIKPHTLLRPHFIGQNSTMVTKLTALLPEMLEKKYIKLWLFLNKIIPFLIIVILNNVALAIKKIPNSITGRLWHSIFFIIKNGNEAYSVLGDNE